MQYKYTSVVYKIWTHYNDKGNAGMTHNARGIFEDTFEAESSGRNVSCPTLNLLTVLTREYTRDASLDEIAIAFDIKSDPVSKFQHVRDTQSDPFT